jgi:hypothetical protein
MSTSGDPASAAPTKSQAGKPLLACCIAGIVVPVLLLAAGSFWVMNLDSQDIREIGAWQHMQHLESEAVDFDSEGWKSGDQTQRTKMALRLSQSHVLLGKSVQEVLDLLGPPDEYPGSRADVVSEEDAVVDPGRYCRVDASGELIQAVWFYYDLDSWDFESFCVNIEPGVGVTKAYAPPSTSNY